jgi:hypothetical protein
VTADARGAAAQRRVPATVVRGVWRACTGAPPG